VTNLAATSAGASCPACGAGVPAEARFCPACGGRPLGGDEERRVVTVLFADVVDSTSLVESLDPEAARDLLNETFRRLAAEVRRFGGTVEKYIGDAVFAVFGFPTGHDDDAARAARAALAMREVVEAAGTVLGQTPPRLRIGLDTGEVAAGAWAGDLRVTGPAVHTAARIQQAAEPGQILLSARTMRAARDAVAAGPGAGAAAGRPRRGGGGRRRAGARARDGDGRRRPRRQDRRGGGRVNSRRGSRNPTTTGGSAPRNPPNEVPR
jgi:class 3 adenylate cyclase